MLTSVVMDTTDAFHTYRLEILQEKVWLFIDGNFATSATTSVAPFATLDIGGNFGDGSVFSESVTERMSVIVGSLADIGGPSMPEPATGFMLMLGMAVMFLGGRTLVSKRF
jgi:hypothetical protein